MAEQYPLTKHAKQQMDARRVRVEALTATLSFGRKVHIRGAIIYASPARLTRRTAKGFSPVVEYPRWGPCG